MYIVDMTGLVLMRYDLWDTDTVQQAERWIEEHGYTIHQVTDIRGICIVKVKEV